MGKEIVLVAFSSDRGGKGLIRGVAEYNDVVTSRIKDSI